MKKTLMILLISLISLSGYAQKWESTKYSSWISGVWDEETIPSCIPKLDGIKVKETVKKTKDQECMGVPDVGSMSFTNTEYETVGVIFYCNKAQFDQLCREMESAGFLQYKLDEGRRVAEYANNDYFVMFSYRQDFTGSGYEGSINMQIVSAGEHPKPASIFGVPLPQTGVITQDPRDFSITTYTGSDYADVPFDLSKDNTLPKCDRYIFGISDYAGTTIEDYHTYLSELSKAGLTKSYSKNIDGRYEDALFKKGDMLIGIHYYPNKHCIITSFSNSDDMLWN